MSGQVSRGSAGEYQADERAVVAHKEGKLPKMDEFTVLSIGNWENFTGIDKIMGMLLIERHEATELSLSWHLCLTKNG